MHTYMIFYAVTSCDKDWQYLGDIKADDSTEAFEKAVQQWGREYASCDLIVLEVATVVL